MKHLIILLTLPLSLFAQANPNNYTMTASGPPAMNAGSVSINITPNPGGKINPKNYYIQVNYPIGAPALTGPISCAVQCPDTKDGGSIVLTWTAQPGAISYDVIVIYPAAPYGELPPSPGVQCICVRPTSTGITGTSFTDGGFARTSYTPAIPVQPAVCGMSLINLSEPYAFVEFGCPVEIPPTPGPGLIDCSNVNYLDPAQAAIAENQCAVNNTFIRSTDFCPLSQVNGTTDNTACLQAFLNAGGVSPTTYLDLVAPVTIGQGYVCSSLSWGTGNYVSLTIEKGAYPSCAIPAPDFAHYVIDKTTNPILPWPSNTTSQSWVIPSVPNNLVHGTRSEVAYFASGSKAASIPTTLLYTVGSSGGGQLFSFCTYMSVFHSGTSGSVQLTLSFTDGEGAQTQLSPSLTLGSTGVQANACYIFEGAQGSTISYATTVTGGTGGSTYAIWGVLEIF